MRILSACLTLTCGLCAAGSASPAAAQPRIHLPEEQPPPILERVGTPQGLSALVIAPSGERAAAVLAPADDEKNSTVLLYSIGAAEPAALELGGLMRDLLFAPDSASVLGLLHRPAKKREGETYLVRIELDPPRARRLTRLPPSAASLDLWPARATLLVAARNEIRTLSYPDLRSGPLYRVTGDNLAVAVLARGGLVLVGQEDALLLIDLDDPPGEREMPVRERIGTAQAVISLAAAADGSKVLARLRDGTVHAVEFGPLRLAPSVPAGPVAEAGRPLADTPPESAVAPREQPGAAPPAGPPPTPEPVSAAATEPERAVAAEAPARPEAPSAEQPAPAPAAAPAAEPTPAAIGPAERPAPAPVATAAPPEPEAAAPPSAAAAAPPAHQVQGSVGGPALADVVAVVLLGPDNLLREALRVTPGEDGSWSADGLEPGRYRVMLDGGGKRVIVSQPPFLLLEIRAGESIAAGEIRALRAL